jgi:hypothetical protein
VSDGTSRSLHAWVDESVHVGNGLYLLAAAIAPDDEAKLEACRDHLRSLVRHARGRLHWRNEEEIDHIAISEAIGSMPLSSIVVTATRLDPKKQERARRKCLEQLLHRLVTDGVEQVWLESRDVRGNSRDLAMVANLRSARTLPGSIRVDHARPLEEPLLWLPDSIAGAVAAAHDGHPRFRAPLLHMLDEITFEL